MEQPEVARGTGLSELRQFAETSGAPIFSHCRLLTPTLPCEVIYEPRTGWLRARTEEVVRWLPKVDLSLWKNAEEGLRDERASGRADTP